MLFQCKYCKAILDSSGGIPGDFVTCGQCEAELALPENKIAPGVVLGDFLIVQEIGIGGMGRVYLGQQISLERPVAIKILDEKFAQNPQFVENFIREARHAAALNHPGIVQAYAVNEEEGCYYFAMELLNGKSLLQEILDTGRIPPKNVFAIALEIFVALEYAWREKRIIHGDLKPGNIMITDDGRIKLTDLGLSRKLLEGQSSGAEELYATPQYMAPELVLNVPADCRSDIYSMGVTLFYALTGQLPYSGDSTDNLVAAHLSTPLPSMASIAPEIPPEQIRFVEILLAKRPEHRYPGYPELITDLKRIQRGEMPLMALSPLAQEPIQPEIPAEVPAESALSDPPPQAKRFRKWFVLSGIFLALALTMTALLCIKDSKPVPQLAIQEEPEPVAEIPQTSEDIPEVPPPPVPQPLAPPIPKVVAPVPAPSPVELNEEQEEAPKPPTPVPVKTQKIVPRNPRPARPPQISPQSLILRQQELLHQRHQQFVQAQERMRKMMLSHTRNYEFDRAKRIFADMAKSTNPEERVWANMWRSILEDADNFYDEVRKSKANFTGIGLYKQNWEAVRMRNGKLQVRRPLTEKELKKRRKSDRSVYKEDIKKLENLRAEDWRVLGRRALANRGKSLYFNQMYAHFLLAQGHKYAPFWLHEAHASPGLFHEYHLLRDAK